MLRRHTLSLFFILGAMCLSLTPGYNNANRNSSYTYPENGKPGVSDGYEELGRPIREATGREEIAYMDERDRDIHQRADRKGDWGYKQNWRYDREAFYRGETQGEAYDKEHPDGIGGPGMEPDTEYLQMRKYYMEDANRQNGAAVQRNNGARAYGNDQQMSDQAGQYSPPGNYPNRYPSNGY